MAKFQTRIEDYIGTQSDTAALSDWLTEGARVVANALKPDKLELYAIDKGTIGVPGSAIDITGGRPIDAHCVGYKAKLYPASEKAMLVDADSIHYAILTSPAWYMESSKAFVKPFGIVRWFGYPTVTFDVETIVDYPSEALGAIVLYASIQGQIRRLTDLTTITIGNLVFSNISAAITPPATPSFTWTDAVVATVGLSLVSFTDSLLFTPPVFGGTYTDMNTALANQDGALAIAYSQRIQNQLNEYSQDIQNAVAKFQEDLQEYQAGLQKTIENARLESQRLSQQAQLTNDINMQNEIYTLKEQVDEYNALLGRYQGQITYYGAQVQGEVARIQTLMAQYSLMSQNYLQILESLRAEFKISLETL
jgi:hypothetical protein